MRLFYQFFGHSLLALIVRILEIFQVIRALSPSTMSKWPTTASAFNQLDQYVNTPANTAFCYALLAIFTYESS